MSFSDKQNYGNWLPVVERWAKRSSSEKEKL
jgi:hypothetical protein